MFQKLLPCMLHNNLFAASSTRCLRQLSSTRALFNGPQTSADFDEEGLPKDYKLATAKLVSRRLDTLVHKVTSFSKLETEKTIAKGHIRVNEEVIKKKAYSVEEGDEIDIWESKYEENPDLINIRRLKVKSLTVNTTEGYVFVLKYWKKLQNNHKNRQIIREITNKEV